MRLLHRHVDTADGDGRSALDMLSKHRPVVHLVDVVAGENQHETPAERLDDIEISIHCIGRAPIADAGRAVLASPRRDEVPWLGQRSSPDPIDVP